MLVTVSVVVPAYNAEKYFAETLKSVLAQSFADWELVVVDDGSTDSTAPIAKEYETLDARIRLVQQQNKGLAGARNKGYEEASKESLYFLFLDADDLLEPGALEALLAAFKSAPDAKAVFGQAGFIDAQGEPLLLSSQAAGLRLRWTLLKGKPATLRWDSLADLPPSYQSLLYGSCIRTPGLVLISRQSLADAGVFDPIPHGVEDWDLWLRLSLRGKILPTEQAVLKYRIHGANMSSRLDFMRLGELKMRKKLLESPDLSAEQRKQAVAALRFHYLGRDRLPLVTSAREIVARALRQPSTGNPLRLERGSVDEMRRDLLILTSLKCDATLSDKILRADMGDIPDLTQSESAKALAAYRALLADERRLINLETLRRLSLKWPLLPFRKAFRLSRHLFLRMHERSRQARAGED